MPCGRFSGSPVTTTFIRLNTDWNAEPNAPDPVVRIENGDVVLEFVSNYHLYKRFDVDQCLRLRFPSAIRYRLGPTNDEGWYRGQCRFSKVAPLWGEFYELHGDLKLDACRYPWVTVGGPSDVAPRHFLFYLRDQTFECR